MAQGNASPGFVGSVQNNQISFGTSPSPYTMGGNANLTFNPSTNTLSALNLSVTGTTTLSLKGKVASLVGPTGGINNSETIVVGGSTSTQIPANFLAVGTAIRIQLGGTCTASAANISTFRVRFGTAGTTGDGTILSAATAVSATTGTSIPFFVTILIVVTAIGSGSSATVLGNFSLANQSGAAVGTACTGIVVVPSQQVLMTATGFNSTVANYIECTYVAALTTTTCTFQTAVIEIL
jgi:hypothetical protein